MPTLISDPPPAEVEAFLERRRRLGLDRHDEVWEGTHRMMPAPGLAHRLIDRQLGKILDPLAAAVGLLEGGELNLGTKDDFREPDRALWRGEDSADWQETVALAVEIVSPGDGTWEKLPFYAAHHVDELLIVDPRERSVDWPGLDGGEYRPIERSRLIDLGPATLAQMIDWPTVG
jgi:Uma2 family endonuclease